MSDSAQAAPGMRSGGSRIGMWFQFLLVAVIWGSTWLVIKDQISHVPAGWAATWRFAVAAIGMVVLALARGESLRLPPGGMRLTMLMGVFQFCLNFQFVYRAELYVTSGIVAVLYALLMVPNAILARIFLKTPLGARFLAGSAVALGGISLLMLHEYRMAPPSASVPLGILFALAGLLSASAANVMQASGAMRRMAMVPMLAWAMIWGVLADFVLAWIMTGPPVFDLRPVALLGALYLGLIGSVVTFPLYFGLIRTMGAGKAAYNGVLVPVVAMALSTAFEGYRWSVLAASGAALCVAGLLIALSASPKDRE